MLKGNPICPVEDFHAMQPNILFILTDQHHAGYLGCMGQRLLHTPSIDALAENSHVFHSAYTPSPVCSPARVSLFTNKYPLEHGVVCNWIPLEDESTLLTKRLATQGYFNALVGKLHITPVADMHGFDWRKLCDSPHDLYDRADVEHNDYLQWASQSLRMSRDLLVALAGESERYPVEDRRFWVGWPWVDDVHQMTTWAGNEAESFLRSYDRNQPFFLNVSFFGPHHPYATCEPWDSMYPPDQVALPETLGRVPPAAMAGPRFDWSPEQWRKVIALYCGNISAIDKQIGRLLSVLRERGLWNNTVIIFSSDHGDHMGEYSQLGKGTMLESSVRVPMLIKPPGPDIARQDRDEVVSLCDLHPTLCDYAGFDSPPRSLRPLLEGSNGWVSEAFSYYGNDDGSQGTMMISREGSKLAASIQDTQISFISPETQYDSSPGDEDHGRTRQEMEDRLRDWWSSQRTAAAARRSSM